MALNFEWDANKAKSNFGKAWNQFRRSFLTVFGDPRSLTIPDPAHSDLENRFITVGTSHPGKLLVVVHTERGDDIRIIKRASRE